jgi:pimeloyl-ACP methyl ester carboxylesterase
MPARRRGTIERPGCRLTYEVVGEGPPLVFAHGLGGCLMSWWQQVGHFARSHVCIAFSHRGFWPSTAPEGGPDPADYAGDLAALVDQLGLGPIALVCQSMGGWTGVEYALSRPGAVTALVLAATTGSIDPARLRKPERARLGAWKAESTAARAALAAAGVHPAAGARMAAEQPAQHLLYAQIDALSAGLDKEAVRSRLDALRRRAPEELAAARCRLLCLAGGEDVVMPPFAAAAIAAAVPGARAATIPDSGHSAYFERPAAFNALVEDFLAGG